MANANHTYLHYCHNQIRKVWLASTVFHHSYVTFFFYHHTDTMTDHFTLCGNIECVRFDLVWCVRCSGLVTLHLYDVLINYYTGNATIYQFPEDTTTNITEAVSFTCSASGIPLPDISWFKDGSPLDPGINITQSTNGTSLTSVLVLNDLVLSDAGQYSCNASHPISGTDSREFTFTVQSKKEIPSILFLFTVCTRGS